MAHLLGFGLFCLDLGHTIWVGTPKGDKALKMGLGDGRTYRRADVQTDRQMNKFPVFFRTLPKGNMWSAIPVALLCMIVNWSKRK